MAAEPTDSLKAIQEFISQWWVAFALTGLLLLVVAWKMNPRSANIIVALSWGILIVSAYRAPFFARQDTIPHVLFTTLFASALGLVLYFLLWTVIKDAPLNVLANRQSGQINDVTIASIQWSHNFGKLTIVVITLPIWTIKIWIY